jgi:hypothetical protein
MQDKPISGGELWMYELMHPEAPLWAGVAYEEPSVEDMIAPTWRDFLPNWNDMQSMTILPSVDMSAYMPYQWLVIVLLVMFGLVVPILAVWQIITPTQGVYVGSTGGCQSIELVKIDCRAGQ